MMSEDIDYNLCTEESHTISEEKSDCCYNRILFIICIVGLLISLVTIGIGIMILPYVIKCAYLLIYFLTTCITTICIMIISHLLRSDNCIFDCGCISQLKRKYISNKKKVLIINMIIYSFSCFMSIASITIFNNNNNCAIVFDEMSSSLNNMVNRIKIIELMCIHSLYFATCFLINLIFYFFCSKYDYIDNEIYIRDNLFINDN